MRRRDEWRANGWMMGKERMDGWLAGWLWCLVKDDGRTGRTTVWMDAMGLHLFAVLLLCWPTNEEVDDVFSAMQRRKTGCGVWTLNARN